MKKITGMLALAAGLAAAVLLLSALPVWIGDTDGQLRLYWEKSFAVITHYLVGLFNGDSYRFTIGLTPVNFLKEFPEYWLLSAAYLAVSGIIALLSGVLFGIILTKARKAWMKEILQFLSVIPDFVMILFLQLTVVLLYEWTGIRFAKVGSLTMDDPAVTLPLISMTLIPGLYVMRTVALHAFQAMTEEYILLARAKGVNRIAIYIRHVLPNVLPFLKADLNKIIGLMMGNLFVVEYMYNLRGMTRLIFSASYDHTYQYQVTANAFYLLLLLYLLLYLLLRGCLSAMERGAAG